MGTKFTRYQLKEILKGKNKAPTLNAKPKPEVKANAPVGADDNPWWDDVERHDNAIKTANEEKVKIKSEAEQVQKVQSAAETQGAYESEPEIANAIITSTPIKYRANKFSGKGYKKTSGSQQSANNPTEEALESDTNESLKTMRERFSKKRLSTIKNKGKGSEFGVNEIMEQTKQGIKLAKNNDAAKQMTGYGDDFADLTPQQRSRRIREMNAEKLDKLEQEGPSLRQKLYGYKVPQYAAGSTVVGGGLVLAMSSNRGQQSNAQLYGQAPMQGRGY